MQSNGGRGERDKQVPSWNRKKVMPQLVCCIKNRPAELEV